MKLYNTIRANCAWNSTKIKKGLTEEEFLGEAVVPHVVLSDALCVVSFGCHQDDIHISGDNRHRRSKYILAGIPKHIHTKTT